MYYKIESSGLRSSLIKKAVEVTEASEVAEGAKVLMPEKSVQNKDYRVIQIIKFSFILML